MSVTALAVAEPSGTSVPSAAVAGAVAPLARRTITVSRSGSAGLVHDSAMLSGVRCPAVSPVTLAGGVVSGGLVSGGVVSGGLVPGGVVSGGLGAGALSVHTYLAVTLTVRPALTRTRRFDGRPVAAPAGVDTARVATRYAPGASLFRVRVRLTVLR